MLLTPLHTLRNSLSLTIFVSSQNLSIVEDNELKENYVRSPWVIIAENVQQDLLSSFEVLKNEMNSEGLEKVKPTLVARLGKILFHG